MRQNRQTHELCDVSTSVSRHSGLPDTNLAAPDEPFGALAGSVCWLPLDAAVVKIDDEYTIGLLARPPLTAVMP